MHWNRFLLAASLISSVLLHVPEVSGQTAPMVYKKRYAMGTVFEVVAYGDSAERTSSAIDQALDEVVRLDNVMSNFKPDSDLSRMNREAHFRAVRIPADLYQVIETSRLFTAVGWRVRRQRRASGGFVEGGAYRKRSSHRRPASTGTVLRRLRKNQIDRSGSNRVPLGLHARRPGIHWKRICGGSSDRDPALQRHRASVHRCGRQHDLWPGHSARSRRLVGAPTRPIASAGSASEADQQQRFDVRADSRKHAYR